MVRKKKQEQQQAQYEQYEQNTKNLPLEKKVWSVDNSFQCLKFKTNKYTSNQIEVILIISLKLMIIIHAFITYMLLTSNDIQQVVKYYLNCICGDTILSIMIQIGLYILKVFQFIAIYFSLKRKKYSTYLTLCEKIIANFFLLVEVDLVLSSLFLLVNFGQNIFSFLIASIFYVFNVLLFVNYFNREDILYISSIKDYLLLNLIIILNYILNALFLRFSNFQLFVFADLLFSVAFFVWYINKGYFLIPNATFGLFLKKMVIFKMANSLLFIDYYIYGQPILFINYVIKLIISSVIIYFFISTKFSKTNLFQVLHSEGEISNIKKLDILLTSWSNTHERSKLNQHFILSIIQYHQNEGCNNDSCCNKMQQDLLSQSRDSISQQQRSLESSLNLFLKCIYQASIKNNKNNPTLLLEYCEFILNKFDNLYVICKVISIIKFNELGLFDQLNLRKLHHLLQQSNQAFNRNLFEGKLDIENIIIAERCFDDISGNIENSINLELEVWNVISKQDINLTQVRQIFNKNLQLIAQTNKKWSSISKYLKSQKIWRYLYINYSLFILNKKLFYKDTEEFRNYTDENFFMGQSVYLYQNDNKQNLINRNILFDNKTFYMHTFMNDKTMEILNVSRNFQHFVQYTDPQIIGNDINVVMPMEIGLTHYSKVVDWLQKGYSTNQNIYKPTFTSFVTKNGQQFRAVKYYKLFININSDHILEFVCLLKINELQRPEIKGQKEYFVQQTNVGDKSIKRDFNATQNNILDAENNIFIKEDNLKSNEHIQEIHQSKKSIRLCTFCIIGLVITLMLLSNSDTTTLQDNITQLMNFLNLYRYPMALSKNYMKYFLKIGTSSTIVSQINFGTQKILSFNSNPLTLKTLFDKSLNPRNQYPPFLNDTFNKGLSYDQVEIYSIIISCITSLTKLPINRTGSDFTTLNMYIIPSYDNMINSTKIKFHQTFQTNLLKMLIDQIIMAVTQLIIFILILVFVSIKIYSYFKKSRNILHILSEFSDRNIKKIQKYWYNLREHFQTLNSRNRAFSLDIIRSQTTNNKRQIDLNFIPIKQNLQQQQNITYNKHTKYVYQTKKAKGRLTKTIFVIVTSLFVLISGVLSIQIVNIIQVKKLKSFENEGFYFLKYFPATSVLGHALLEKYYHQIYPNQINYHPSRYADYVSDMYLIGSSPYIGKQRDASSSYYQKQKNYMFGNPCTYNPKVLIDAGSTVAQCQAVYNKTFSNGISAFLLAAHSQVESYINGNITLKSTELNDLTSALTLVAYYITDAITTWADEFSAQIAFYQNRNSISCILAASIILLLHFIFCEKLLFYYLQQDYKFIRQIFYKMIPQFIISIDKVMRQKFVMQGIIKQ